MKSKAPAYPHSIKLAINAWIDGHTTVHYSTYHQYFETKLMTKFHTAIHIRVNRQLDDAIRPNLEYCLWMTMPNDKK